MENFELFCQNRAEYKTIEFIKKNTDITLVIVKS